MQMAAYALGQLLPEEQQPFPMDMIHINDTRSDIVPNAGQLSPHVAFTSPAGQALCLVLRSARATLWLHAIHSALNPVVYKLHGAGTMELIRLHAIPNHLRCIVSARCCSYMTGGGHTGPFMQPAAVVDPVCWHAPTLIDCGKQLVCTPCSWQFGACITHQVKF